MLAFLDKFSRNDEVVDVLANRFILGVAEHRRELTVDPDDVIVLVENCNRLGSVLEERDEVHVLRLQRVVKTFSVGDIDRDSDGPGDSAIAGAKRLDPRLEGAAAPIGLVTNELALERAQMRGKRCKARVSGFKDLIESHAHLLAGAGADQVQAGALRESDVQLRIGGPEVDWHRLQHEAEPPFGIRSELTGLGRRGRRYRGARSQPPENASQEAAEWLKGPQHYGRRPQLASHSLTLPSRT